MSLTLLIEENEDKRKLYTLNLNIYIGTEVVWKGSCREAIEILNSRSQVDLIICRSRNHDELSAQHMIQYLLKSERKIPLLVLGNCPQQGSDIYALEDNCDIKSIIGQAAKILQVKARSMAELSVPELYPIPMGYFFTLSATPCDVYVRVQRNEGEDHFIKRFNGRDEISIDALKRYMAFGQENLYIPAKDRVRFVQIITKRIIDRLEKQNPKDLSALILTEHTMDVVAKEIQDLGLTEEIVALSKASIHSINRIAKCSPSLGQLFQKLLNNRVGFLYQHCQMIVYVCRHMIHSLDWGTEEHVHRLSFVCFFHDIVLPNAKLARIGSDEALAKANLSDDEKSVVIKHAHAAAEILKNYPNAPLGVDILVRQHHGTSTGIGFTTSFSTSLSPLAMIFVLAEEFVHALLEIQGNDLKAHRDRIVVQMKEKYDSLKYKQMIEILQTLRI